MYRRFFAAIVFVGALAATAPAGAADKDAGRKHLKKASGLANKGNCKGALPEFTKAYDQLKDPTILFNRGECYRKTGDGAKAIADFKQFLADFPAAPNRKQVETRIAELEAPKAAPAPTVAAGKGPAKIEKVPAPPAPAPVMAVAPPPPKGEPLLAPGMSSPEPLLAPDIKSDPGPPVDLMQAPPPPDEGGSVAGKAWFWVVLGVVVVGAGAAGWLVLNSGKTDVPTSKLGTYRF